MRLLGQLRPIYFRQPPHVSGELAWRRGEANYLAAAGQRDAALDAWRKLATDYADVYDLQQQYAQQLAGRGDYDAAYAWLRAAIQRDVAWQPYEINSLRGNYVNLLTQQGRYEDVVKVIAEWDNAQPLDATRYNQYLTALILSDQEKIADAR